MKLGFVILVYGKASMAKECIDYLQALDNNKDSSIVIVDNCSPDNTYELLTDWFDGNDNVHIIHNTTNQGFAEGNNIGYTYAKEQLHCDWIVVMNSDVFIKDKKFITILKKEATILANYEVIGPDIVNLDGHHSNPLSTTQKSTLAIRREILLNDISILYYKLGLYRFIKRHSKRRNNASDDQKTQVNIIPHGACIIYTPNWVNKENKAFYSGTFLFCEEWFLFDYIVAKGYKSIYFPKLIINHILDGSIDGDKPSKKIFINSCQSRSLKLLLKFRQDIIGNWNK